MEPSDLLSTTDLSMDPTGADTGLDVAGPAGLIKTSASGTYDGPAGPLSCDGVGGSSWLELDADPLAELGTESPGNALTEVDRLLARAGISGGKDFQEVVAWLDADLRTRAVLCRCLPGLASVWDHYADIITDALQQVGPGLAPDPAATVLPLLGEPDGLAPALETCDLDSIALYRHELAAVRVLTLEEQRVLGQWIADARYLAEKSASAPVHTDWSRAAEVLLDNCVLDLREAWPLVLRALLEEPGSAAEWRAALVALGLRGVGDEQVAKIATVMRLPEDEIRAALRRAEAVCRVLPDAALAALSEHAADHRECPGTVDGRGAEGFAPDFAQRIERGEAARQVLVRHTLRFVVAIARPYAQALHSLELGDLVQEGALGLIRAVEKWEPGRGYALTTFAGWWIKQAITRAIADDDLVVRLPVHMQEKVRPALKDCVLGFPRWRERETLCDADLAELEALACSASAWNERFELVRAAGVANSAAILISGVLDPVPLEGEVLTAVEAIQDDDPEDNPEQATVTNELVAQVYVTLDTLPGRERRVLELRYGLDGGPPRTLEVVGYQFGFTRERARQIEAKAIKKLLHPSRAKQLRTLVMDKPSRRSAQTALEQAPASEQDAPVGAPAPRSRRRDSNTSRSGNQGRELQAGRLATDRSIDPEIQYLLTGLTPTARRLVTLRYGLHDGKTRSFDELQRHLGVPRERILRMLRDALADIRTQAGTSALDLLVSGKLRAANDRE